MNLLSGVVSTGILILSLTLTSGNAAKYFSATLGLVISMVTITYVLIFPAVIKLRYRYPDVPRPYLIPGGKAGLWAVGILTTAWAAFTTVAVIYPGIGTASPDSSLPPGFAGQRLQYELSQLVPLAVMVLVGLLFYALGRRTGSRAGHSDHHARGRPRAGLGGAGRAGQPVACSQRTGAPAAACRNGSSSSSHGWPSSSASSASSEPPSAGCRGPCRSRRPPIMSPPPAASSSSATGASPAGASDADASVIAARSRPSGPARRHWPI